MQTACKQVKGSTPNSPAPTAEQQVYADLFTIQTALNGVKAEAKQYPAVADKLKDQINQAIQSYNTALAGFTAFEKTKNTNVYNPADIVNVQNQIIQLQTQINTLGQAFSSAVKPTAVQEAK